MTILLWHQVFIPWLMKNIHAPQKIHMLSWKHYYYVTWNSTANNIFHFPFYLSKTKWLYLIYQYGNHIICLVKLGHCTATFFLVWTELVQSEEEMRKLLTQINRVCGFVFVFWDVPVQKDFFLQKIYLSINFTKECLAKVRCIVTVYASNYG